jgi:hypothetical protein
MLVLWMLCGVAEKEKENPCKIKTLKLQYMASCHLSYVLHACNTCYTYTFQAGQGKARPRHCLILCSSLHHLGFWMFEDTTWQPINSHVRKETNYIFLRASHHDLSAGFLSFAVVAFRFLPWFSLLESIICCLQAVILQVMVTIIRERRERPENWDRDRVLFVRGQLPEVCQITSTFKF